MAQNEQDKKLEFWAKFDLYDFLERHSQNENGDLLDAWVEKRGKLLNYPWGQITDKSARQMLLAAVLLSDAKVQFQDSRGRSHTSGARDYARTGALQYHRPGGLFYWYYGVSFPNPNGPFQEHLSRQISEFLRPLHLIPDLNLDLSLFPPGSWAVQLTFTLRKPYLSRDDVDFYILDNPVKKEWVFKVPYVAPSQWKGALRAAMRRLRGYTTWAEEAQDAQMVRLFGNVKGEEEEFAAGRLHFYPTFFDRIGLEVINPHDRETGAGTLPIYFECVPAGTEGTLTLLYMPLDNGPADEATCKADLKAVAQGIRAMLTVYGFGAKTSSGYGVAEVERDASRVQANGIADAERIFWEAWDGTV